MTADRLIVWRHGRTAWNAIGRFQGQVDVPLDDLGREQARLAAAVLARQRIDLIVASDLSRARATAQTLADEVGLEVRLDPRLREIHVGSWEGMTAEQVHEVDPAYADAYARGEDVRRSPTGENTTEVAERAGLALIDIADRAPEGSTVVAAMHGLAGKVGVCRFLGWPYEGWHTIAGMDNCGWAVLQRARSGHWRLHGYNVTAEGAHLDERPVSPEEDARVA